MTDKQTITFKSNINLNNENEDKLTTFYKVKQAKNFTLTDHFKLYKMQQK